MDPVAASEDHVVPESLDPVLVNPKRLLIASILYMLGPRTMSFIQKALHIPWGPLYTHIKRMEKEGYIRVKKTITLLGPRTVIELTDKGLKAYEELLEKLNTLLEKARKTENPAIRNPL